MDTIKVEEIELDVTLPDNGIGMVIMQPFVEICDREPYHWQNDKKDKQIERIIRTLEIAKKADHGCEKTHFTIFPEYSIPGLEGIKKIEEIVRSDSWESGTIVIGGIGGLTKGEYSGLCKEDMSYVHGENEPERIQQHQWVNCCITWAKQTEGTVKRWIQPKLVPAGQQELCPAYHMFGGKAVYVFRPKISIQGSELPFRFFSFICKDWIGNIGGSNIVDLVLSQLERQRNDGIDRLDIYLCFVLQRNPRPNYSLFLQNTVRYLNENICISIRRSDGAVLFVNNAGRSSPSPCTEYGKSGFVFHPNCSFVSHKQYCPPTYTLKNRKDLATCKEARFRENGACIISFKFLPPIPAIVRSIPATSMVPMNPAIVHSVDPPIEGLEGDPRTPGDEVPASVKWVNDCLDVVGHLLEHEREHPLKNQVKTTHEAVCKEIRKGNDAFLCRYIVMASCGIEKEEDKWIDIKREIPNVDNWDGNEGQSLETVLHSLSITKVWNKSLKVNGSPAHATMKIQDKIIDVVVAHGKTHKECFEYAKNQFPGSGQRFVIVVTRDIHNTFWDKKFGSILKGVQKSIGKASNITDPDTRFNRCGYQNLIDSCFNSRNLSKFNSKVTEVMGV